MTKPRITLKTADDLVAAGFVPASAQADVAAVGERYAISITPAMAALIDPCDDGDPIARQFVPTAAELITTVDERSDPIGDAAHAPVKGIVHRYRDRVLLKLAHICPVYCRFCFRRETVGVGSEAMLTAAELEAALAYIGATPGIFEVIVTGGDPLVLAPRRLADVTAALGEIAHVRVIRWHTRVPVVAPERVTPDLVAALASHRKAVFVALHVNHPRELTRAARAACTGLIDAGIPMVSQTVLLKGVNDDAAVLEDLMRDLVALRIKPYYLHHGDLAPGTAHFRTTFEAGQALMRALRGRLSGLAQPTYVLDVPGGFGKVPVTSDHIGRRDPRTATREVIDPEGGRHIYRDGCADPTL
ncbi:MAG: lysine-2,3-aminomutase-like protein [Hyphomicrobiaceae bacterium]|nr:lysine-2,3-aminomutase-like protein [Hyphomicrobiaceae bacterium]